MRSLIEPPARMLVAIAEWWLEESVPAERLQRWMVSATNQLVRRQRAGRTDVKTWADVEQADWLLRGCGFDWWPKDVNGEQSGGWPSPAAARAILPEEELGKQFIYRGVVAVNAGITLDHLANSLEPNIVAAVDDNAERLLRHVETRRRKAISEFANGDGNAIQLRRTERWMQRHDIAIFFFRHARRRNDIRFLNTALKLNDWAFPAHKRVRRDEQAARYLLALAEQETTYHQWSRACESPFSHRLPAVSTRAS